LLCPKCGDEFQPGFSVCPDCEVSLVSHRPEQKEPLADELVTVATFENQVEASVARGALEAEGIPAFVPEEHVGSFALNRSVPQLTWSELKVRPSDRNHAVEILRRAGHR